MPELGAQFKIYRGEIRRAIPTPERPDPAAALTEDPHGFIKDWVRPQYPYPEGWHGLDVSVGQHWTRSPEAIPERFAVEPLMHGPQPGVPMGKREATAVSRQTAVESGVEASLPPFERRELSYGDPDEAWSAEFDRIEKHEQARAQMQKLHRSWESTYLPRAEREGVNRWRDLSGGERPDSAKPYLMGVVWEAHVPEGGFEHGTNYEDEHNLPHESKVNITGARLYIPRSGVTHDPRQRHPSPFTADERFSARLDTFDRSGYSFIGEQSSVPWNRVQFDEPIEMMVKHDQHLGNYAR